MSSIYLDHNVSRDVISPLRWAGHDVLSARDLGLTRLPDDAQVLSAVRARRVLVTHNRRHFTLLHDAWVTWPLAFGVVFPAHPGILLLNTAPPLAISDAVNDILGATPASLLASNLFWWHHRDGWRRRLVGNAWEPYPLTTWVRGRRDAPA